MQVTEMIDKYIYHMAKPAVVQLISPETKSHGVVCYTNFFYSINFLVVAKFRHI